MYVYFRPWRAAHRPRASSAPVAPPRRTVRCVSNSPVKSLMPRPVLGRSTPAPATVATGTDIQGAPTFRRLRRLDVAGGRAQGLDHAAGGLRQATGEVVLPQP